MNLKLRFRSTAYRWFASERYLNRLRSKARKQHKSEGDQPTVHYFHQVDDPFSHLSVQKLDLLRDSYDLPFEIHLVSDPDDSYKGSGENFDEWARLDAMNIANGYGTQLKITVDPSTESINAANNALANCLEDNSFAQKARQVGDALWSGDLAGEDLNDQTSLAISRGDHTRQELGHYFGGVFYFEGEWFWGISRLRHLEQRLIDEGFGEGEIQVPEPTPTDTADLDCSNQKLEYFPSLRSPYTAAGHQRVLDLISRSGINVSLRPILPMLMRGIPAPRLKQRYIVIDAAREARSRGVPFRKIVDPIGEPVKRAFEIFPGAMKLNQGMDFVTAYLSSVFVHGIDISTQKGLQQVVDRAGINWDDLIQANAGTDWEALLQQNLSAMLEGGLWGVPSFRVSGGEDPAFLCWGQDRIWRLEEEIARRAQQA